MDTKQIQELAKLARYYILESTTEAGSGHPTSSMSATDLMTTLMAKFLRFDPDNKDNPNNDRLIFSKGHASPENFWYDQAQNEWLIVLKGHARLRFAEEDQAVEMKRGDYINIPAHCKHRVEWTDPNEETIWLAVHY